jgi:acyl carrier protein
VNSQEIIVSLTRVFTKVFENPPPEIRSDMTADEVPGWDSLTHIDLVVAIEKEFKIRFTTSEITGLTNVGDLVSLIQRKTESR